MNYELIDRSYTYKEQDPQYKGEGLDRELASGPNEQRTCRDCLCFIIYIIFWAAMIIVAIYAFANGNPTLLAAPFDSTGRQCGYDNYKDYPFAYYNKNNPKQFGCIQECPTSDTQTFITMFNNSALNNYRFPAYKTIQVVSLCFPVSESINQYISLGLSYYDQAISDLKATWKIQLIALFSALLFSIILMVFIRTFGSCIVLTIVFLYLCGLVGLGVGCMIASTDGIQGYQQYTNPEYLQAAAYICWVLAGLSFLWLLCNLKKLRIAAAVIKTAAQFTREQCKIIIVPFLMFFVITMFFIFWLYSSIYIFSCGEIRPCGTSPYACIDWQVGVKRSLALFLFGLFWNCQVAIAVSQFVIASTAAYWYFSHLGNAKFPLIKSFCRALTYQFGSLIFGALILCIMWILQISLQILHYVAKNESIKDNPIRNACSEYLIRCIRCCFACFERFIRFVTKNAFLMMAITGQGFCTSAQQAFYLSVRSYGQYAITHGVGHTIMFFGKLLVSVAVTLFAYLLVTGLQQFEESIYSPLNSTLMCFVISYVVSSFFMDVFAVAADTILLCYCLQMDILRGLSYACPPNLKVLLDSQK